MEEKNIKKILIKIFSFLLLLSWLWYLFYWNPFVLYDVDNKNISEIWNKISIPKIWEIKKMSIGTLNLFNKWLKDKNMFELYAKSSKEIKNQYTKEEFSNLFRFFIDSNKTYKNISEKTISITREPILIPNTNILFIKWNLLNEFDFEIQYIYQDLEWKLLRLYIFPKTKYKTYWIKNNIKLNIPDNKELKKISTKTLNLLNDWLKNKSFNKLFSSLSSEFKKQVSLEHLNNTFKIFLDKKILFENIDENKISFKENPFLDDYNILVIYWDFTEKEWNVNFKLKYIFENNKWKLLNIKISPLFQEF